MNDQLDIAERIVRVRKEKGLNGEQMGAILGIGRAAVSQIENGKSKPTIEGLARLVEAYGDLNAKWLLTGKGNMLANEGVGAVSGADCWDMLKAERVKTQTLEEILKKHGLLRVE
jgi:transcriptional regulator with XRE-family HTH domain